MKLKKSLSLLKTEVETLYSRGHNIIWSKPFYHKWSNANLQDGRCKYCDMAVQINDNPQPNGIDISGELVAYDCPEA